MYIIFFHIGMTDIVLDHLFCFIWFLLPYAQAGQGDLLFPNTPMNLSNSSLQITCIHFVCSHQPVVISLSSERHSRWALPLQWPHHGLHWLVIHYIHSLSHWLHCKLSKGKGQNLSNFFLWLSMSKTMPWKF